MPNLNTLRADLTAAIDAVEQLDEQRGAIRSQPIALAAHDRRAAKAHAAAADAALAVSNELTRLGNANPATQTLLLYGYHAHLAETLTANTDRADRARMAVGL